MGLIRREQVAGMNIHYLFYSLDYFLEAQKAAGFETIELWAGAPHFYLDSIGYPDCKEISRKIKSNGLQVKVFTAENCTYQYQIGAQTKELREKSFQYFRNGIQAAAELGCKIVQTNSGWGYWNEDRGEAWNRSREMLSRLADEAEKFDLNLAMETLRPDESQLVVTLEDAKRMYDEIHHPNFKVMIDTVPMSIAGETLDQWFETFGSNIIHTHFIDCNPYGHLIWGDGNRNMREFLEVLDKYNYKGCLGQEITDFRYFRNPAEQDKRNMKEFEKFF